MDHIALLAPPNTRSLTVVYEAPGELKGWHGSGPWSEGSAYQDALNLPARPLVQGIFDLCDDLGYHSDVDKVLPKQVDTFTVVLPDGVFTFQCSKFFEDQIALNNEQYASKKKVPTVRILSMSQLLDCKEYQGVMTEKDVEKWRRRADFPHYEMSIEEVNQCINQSKARKQQYLVAYEAGEYAWPYG